MNCYSCGKPRQLGLDCLEQDKLTLKQGNARVYALTQGEADIGTSQVVESQISIAHTSVYALIDSGASHSFMSTLFEVRYGVCVA